MSPTELDRLAHILEAARDARDFVRGRARADLESDRQLRRALIQCFVVIGEAATRLPAQSRARLPDIPWRDMRNMRNLVVHAYFGVDLDILWDTATSDLPGLIATLERELGQEPP
jgi:uncharacterized protein with HEPN domain